MAEDYAAPDWRELCSRMADELDHYRQLLTDDRREAHPLADKARAALARWGGPAPAPAEERQAAPVPVAVSERLPGTEDCDAEGRLWAWCKATKEWCLLNRWHYREESERNAPGWASGWPYWLPFNALPLPSVEVEA